MKAFDADLEGTALNDRDGNGAALARLLIAAVVAFIGLTLYGRNDLSAEDFALRKDDVHATEAVDGVPFTASSVPLMKAAIDRGIPHAEHVALWLGNSQLHTINQMAVGDHLAAYWLRRDITTTDVLPLTFSLPNANFQEELALTAYALGRLKLDLVILSLVFDDLREDDLRDDFKVVMDANLRARLSRSSIGQDMLVRLQRENEKPLSENGGLNAFGQFQIESWLSGVLDRHLALWDKRANLRTHVLTDLYFARNYAFGIKSTTVRHLIPLRYKRNMAALEELLNEAESAGVPVLGYIAPLRPNATSPYDAAEYKLWKSEVGAMLRAKGFSFVNLEDIVPAENWGTYDPNAVDFMHFQAEGHRILARALAPYVTREIAK
jgi:hypothetical protein